VPVPTTLLQSDLPGLPLRHRGKVRDVFDIPRDRLPAGTPPGDYLLMVATDRLSAFDVVLPDPIPGKGEMLCQVSNFWFAKTAHLMPNHLTGIDVASVLPEGVDAALYAKRAVVTRKLKPVPVEAIARGYLIGSGPPACARPSSCPSRSSPRRPRPPSATMTRTSTSMRWSRRSVRTWPSACAMPPCASTSSPPITRASAASSWPTPSSSSAWTKTAP